MCGSGRRSSDGWRGGRKDGECVEDIRKKGRLEKCRRHDCGR